MTLLAAAAKTALALALLLAGAAPLKVTLAAPGHTPKINTRWNYVVRATSGGKPAAAKITALIVDPVGGRHPVEFGKTTKKIRNWPFKGEFRDFVIWPPSSRGVPLTFRLVVVAGTTKRVLNYTVTPHR
jgi:hypothetical protein